MIIKGVAGICAYDSTSVRTRARPGNQIPLFWSQLEEATTYDQVPQ